MASPQSAPIDPKSYLEQERKASVRHELVNGQIFAMAGASRWHVLLTTRIAGELDRLLRAQGCNTGSSDLRIHIPESQAFLYPDVVVYCGEGRWLDDKFDTLQDPIAVIEVLSPSTEGYDRGAKFQHYKRVESLRFFVFVSQDTMNIDSFERLEDGTWVYDSLTRPEQSLSLLDASIPLATIYERVPV